MVYQDVRDLTSFKWASVTSVDPLAIRLDGDSAPLALIPDSLIDPMSLAVNDRVRVELSLRKVVIHGRSQGDPRVAEIKQITQDWVALGAPSSRFSNFINNFSKGLIAADSTLAMRPNAATFNGVEIGVTGIYECEAMQRCSVVNASAYITLALDGSRTDLENRAEGQFYHDHAVGVNHYSTSRYIGLLNAGEIVTAGPPDATSAGYMTFNSTPLSGGLIVRRIS